MPSSTQIIPKYTFPYVETVINDNTRVVDDNLNTAIVNPGIAQFYAFRSSKGIDGTIVKIETQKQFVATFGKSDFKKYGQPLMQAFHVLDDDNAIVYCERVMPENATYAHNVISLGYKADVAKKSFKIKLIENHTKAGLANSIYNKSDLAAYAAAAIPQLKKMGDTPKADLETAIERFTARLNSVKAAISALYPTVDTGYLESAVTAAEYDIDAPAANDMPIEGVGKKVIVGVDGDGNTVFVEVADGKTVIVLDEVEANALSEATVATVASFTEDGNKTVYTQGEGDDAVKIDVTTAYFVYPIAGTDKRAVYEYKEIGEDEYGLVLAEGLDIFTTAFANISDSNKVLYDGITDAALADDTFTHGFLTIVDVISKKVYVPQYSVNEPFTAVGGVVSDTANVGKVKIDEVPQASGIFAYAQDVMATIDAINIAIAQTEVPMDDEGFQISEFMTLRSAGRGSYGDNYRVFATPNSTYSETYNEAMYDFTIGTAENNFVRNATYTAAPVTTTKHNLPCCINDVMDDLDPGVAPIDIRINESALQEVYDAYVAFLEEVCATYSSTDLEVARAAYQSAANTFSVAYRAFTENYPILREEEILSETGACRIPSWVNTEEEVNTFNSELVNVRALYGAQQAALDNFNEIEEEYAAISEGNIVAFDEFDWIFGKKLLSTDSLPFVKIVEDTDLVDQTIATFNSGEGVALYAGSDGYFDNPRTITTQTINSATGTVESVSTKWTLQDEYTEAYKRAWDGTTDSKILSTKRVPVDAFFDANYPIEVKEIMAKLAITRESAPCHLDCGIINQLGSTELAALIETYGGFDNRAVSVDLHSYTIKEPSTNKRVNVTITYFLAGIFTNHILNVGRHIPMVGEYAELTGHLKDSLVPIIEDYESDLKQKLDDNRINYFNVIRDNVFRRATQNTTQSAVSDLSEENNVLVLFEAKRIVEDILNTKFYSFADAATQTLLKKKVDAAFEDWNASIVESVGIEFNASEWEYNHKIIHCYMTVVFRPLYKVAILEIDINKRDANNVANTLVSTDAS